MGRRRDQTTYERPVRAWHWLLGILFFCVPAPAQLVTAVPIFTGEAQTGDGRRIPGTITFTVRVTSTDGPIRAFNFTGRDTVNPAASRGVSGRSCQRWLSTNSNGIYDQPSPGFSTITNLMGEQSLDTHFLFDGVPSHYTITTPFTETGISFPGGNPFPSTPSVGYGLGFGPAGFPGEGLLQGAWDIAPGFQNSVIEPLYVVAGGTVNIAGEALTNTGLQRFAFSVVLTTIPEPESSLMLMLLAMKRVGRGRS